MHRRVLQKLKENPVPTGLGLGLIGAQQYYHIKQREQRFVEDAKEDPEALIIGDAHVALLKSVPWRGLSRFWGHLHSEYSLPKWLRAPVYRLWSWTFNCDLSEIEAQDLREYRNLNEFFTRRLRDDVRPIAPTSVVCPADAKILHFGPVDQRSIEQVKGITYSLDAFLGCGEHSLDPNEKYHHIPYDSEKNQLYHCVLYLAPGDYHRFHSPAHWDIEKLKHFSGQLFSVSPGMVRMIQGLFVLNERIIMLGQWKHGFFSMAAVGATNVGSIELSFDKSLKTNRHIVNDKGSYDEKSFVPDTRGIQVEHLEAVSVLSRNALVRQTLTDDALVRTGLKFAKGAELGQFNMGSTVVLIFEAPKKDFGFFVEAGQKVKYGEPLAGSLSESTGFLHRTEQKESHPPLHTIKEVVDHIGKKDEIL